jgi:hypothetical protein
MALALQSLCSIIVHVNNSHPLAQDCQLVELLETHRILELGSERPAIWHGKSMAEYLQDRLTKHLGLKFTMDKSCSTAVEVHFGYALKGHVSRIPLGQPGRWAALSLEDLQEDPAGLVPGVVVHGGFAHLNPELPSWKQAKGYQVGIWRFQPGFGLSSNRSCNIYSRHTKKIQDGQLPEAITEMVDELREQCSLPVNVAKVQVYGTQAHHVASKSVTHPAPHLLDQTVLAYAVLPPGLRNSPVLEPFRAKMRHQVPDMEQLDVRAIRAQPPAEWEGEPYQELIARWEDALQISGVAVRTEVVVRVGEVKEVRDTMVGVLLPRRREQALVDSQEEGEDDEGDHSDELSAVDGSGGSEGQWDSSSPWESGDSSAYSPPPSSSSEEEEESNGGRQTKLKQRRKDKHRAAESMSLAELCDALAATSQRGAEMLLQGVREETIRIQALDGGVMKQWMVQKVWLLKSLDELLWNIMDKMPEVGEEVLVLQKNRA